MMTQESRPLHLLGAKVIPEVHLDTNTTNVIQHLKKELATKQTENLKLTDQLNCLISLIKRSWTGDKHATLHLSNIVGIEPPQHVAANEGRHARPNSQLYLSAETRSKKNWERLTVKLLNREYLLVQQEIKEYQQQYIENRQAYMDAVLQDHQQTMSRIPLHHKSDLPLEEMDSKFIRFNKVLQRRKANSRGTLRQVQSAGLQKKTPFNDPFEKTEVSLRDLVGDGPSSDYLFPKQRLNEGQTVKPQAHTQGCPQSSTLYKHLPPNTYNDPARYTQGNLFTVNENDGIKKPRPVSAANLRAGDIVRSRPRTGRTISKNNNGEQNTKHVFITQKSERPLKYEATRPASIKPKSAKYRGTSADSKNKRTAGDARLYSLPLTDVISTSSMTVVTPRADNINNDHGSNINKEEVQTEDDSMENVDDHDDISDKEIEKPPAKQSVRAKSAFQRRPACIDEFAEDEQAMRDMQDDFKKTALSLQKKLGIDESGIITLN